MKVQLLRRREILWPTWQGALLLLVSVSLMVALFARFIHGFLAPVQPLRGGDLVVEGWVSDHVLYAAKREYDRAPYRKIYTTGGPLGINEVFCGYSSYAQLAEARLQAMGVPAEAIQAVPAPHVTVDRTLTSAILLRKWQTQHGISPATYHLITSGVHGRRSQELFQIGLGPDAKVGVTSVQDPNYDPTRWWASGAGFRSVMAEAIAYGVNTAMRLSSDLREEWEYVESSGE